MALLNALNTHQPNYAADLLLPSWASKDKIRITLANGADLPQNLSEFSAEEQRGGFVFHVSLPIHNVTVRCDWEGGETVTVAVCDNDPPECDVRCLL